MHSTPTERVEINRKGGDQRLSFTSLHFGNGALVQHHATDQLHVEMSHSQNAAPGLAGYGKGFFKDFVQNLVGGVEALFVDFLLTV